MSGADLWEDGYPHGTVEGYIGGCQGGSCPAGADHGLSCKRAKLLSAGDYRYKRLVNEGLTPAEIAIALDLHAIEHEPKETSMPTPKDAAKASKPLTASPVDVDEQNAAVEKLTTEKFTAGLSQAKKTEKLREIREWCRANGFPGVPTHGKIPNDALAAYDAAHGEIEVVLIADVPKELADFGQDFGPRSDQLDETRSRLEDGPPDDSEYFALESKVANRIADRLGDAFDEKFGEHIAQLEDELTGLPNAEPTEPWVEEVPAQTVDIPAHRVHHFPVGALPSAEGRKTIEQPNGPRPEWAEVAISEDVERARSLAVHLEQEVARLQDERDQAATERDRAIGALGTALQAWQTATDQHAQARDVIAWLRIQLEQERSTSDDLGRRLDEAMIGTMARGDIELLADALRPGTVFEPVDEDEAPRRRWWRRA